MINTNYLLTGIIVIGSIMYTFSKLPKNNQFGLKLIKLGIAGTIVYYFTPIVYSYFDKVIK